MNQDRNLHYSIGNGTILNPYVDNQGYFNGVLYDIYDFNWTWNIKNLDLFKINNSAYFLQLVNGLEKYYILVPIRFKL